MKKLFFVFLTILFAGQTFGQSKMVVGQKHTIFVDIPKRWLQAQNDQLPFFIKPDKNSVNNETYMYVYGIDYNSTFQIPPQQQAIIVSGSAKKNTNIIKQAK